MTIDELFIRALEAEMQEAGNECTCRNDSLFLPAVELEVVVQEATVEDAEGDKVASAIFAARPRSATTAGIKIFQLGYGPIAFDAAREASYQWCLGVYPALLTYIAKPAHRCDVEQASLLVRDDETGEQFGWTIHLPPILSRAYGETLLPDDLKQDAVFRALFEMIHPYAAHKHLFWLECFAVRLSEHEADATCRLNNEDWEEGQEALLQWAMSWPAPGNGLLSQRQFLLFEPTPLEQLPNKTPVWG